jgi:hypothetical protein
MLWSPSSIEGRGKQGVHGTFHQFQQLALRSVSAASTAHTKKCYDPKFAMIVCHVLLVHPTYYVRSQNTKGSV